MNSFILSWTDLYPSQDYLPDLEKRFLVKQGLSHGFPVSSSLPQLPLEKSIVGKLPTGPRLPGLVGSLEQGSYDSTYLDRTYNL